MSFLNLDGGSGSAHIVERLNLERTRRAAKSIGFDAVDVDEAVLHAAVILFRERQQESAQPPTSSKQHQVPQHHQHFTIDSGRRTPVTSRVIQNNPNGSTKSGNVKLEKLCINNCPANPFLEYLIEASMGMDLFREFELQGNMEEEEEQAAELQAAANVRRGCQEASGGANSGDDDDGMDPRGPLQSNIFALDALGFRMRFSRRLRKVELINLPITRDHAESLMYGIETNDETGTGCRLDTLVMEGVRFVDDDETEDEPDDNDESRSVPVSPSDGTVVVRELCEGFPNNRTLTTIQLERCRLTDAQIALVFDSLASHPTLKHLCLSENSCRNLGLEALDRMLMSPPSWMPEGGVVGSINDDPSTNGGRSSSTNYCRLETLELSYQFTSEETYGTGEHIQLGILTRNCTTRDADVRIYPNLRKLVLQGNQIDDSDMKDLAFLIRHRFPHLEELDLRFNEITTQGLEIFANHSDPNHELFLASNSADSSNPSQKHNHRFPPQSSRLRTIRLTNNPLVMTNQTSVVLLKLLKIYPELQLIQSNLEWEDGMSISRYIQHLLDINRAGRFLLLAGSNNNTNTLRSHQNKSERDGLTPGNGGYTEGIVPLTTEEKQRRKQQSEQQRCPLALGAWPLVLARLTRQSRYPHFIPVKNSLNGMYYLIRHGPIIMEQMASGLSNSSSNAKSEGFSNGTNEGTNNEKERIYKRKRGDPALGGYETLADFLRCELGSKPQF